MGIRIQPKEIQVPSDSPFEKDLLSRNDAIEVLSHIVQNIEGPCVIALDAPWGTGKSTFLEMWRKYLENRSFPVVKFNAWETDFTDDPFVALTAELTDGVQEHMPRKERVVVNRLRTQAERILLTVSSNVIKNATQGIIDPAAIMAESASHSVSKSRIANYRDLKGYFSEFRQSLQDAANALRPTKATPPLVVIVDELDRCRPSYAVELLEVAKHLFSVDDIIFVLAINRSELSHSVRVVYGSRFDAESYLRRFFDIDFLLPNPDRQDFITAMIDEVGISSYFERTADRRASFERDSIPDFLVKYFNSSDLSLRSIAQSIHHFGLVYASLASDQRSFITMATVALILRTMNIDLYRRFVEHRASDKDVVDFLNENRKPNRFSVDRSDALFEALLIAAGQEDSNWEFEEFDASPLLIHYKALIAASPSQDDSRDPVVDHARTVVELANRFLTSHRYEPTFGFHYATQRIELISRGLLDQQIDNSSC